MLARTNAAVCCSCATVAITSTTTATTTIIIIDHWPPPPSLTTHRHCCHRTDTQSLFWPSRICNLFTTVVPTHTDNFDTDEGLQDRYRSPWGTVRLGRIFEDLDALAGTIAFEHCMPHSPSLHIVTASVDRIQVHRRADITRKMQVAGRVVWTGRSSLVIEMTASEPPQTQTASAAAATASAAASGPGKAVSGGALESTANVGDNGSGLLLKAGFTFVARDRDTGKPRFINPIDLRTSDEHAVFARHAARANERRERRAAKGAGSAAEAADELADELYSRARRVMALPALAPPDVIMLGETAQSNNFICQPQVRQIANSRKPFLCVCVCVCDHHAEPFFIQR
jgi:acyl-coenzyme A thioesterase 9